MRTANSWDYTDQATFYQFVDNQGCDGAATALGVSEKTVAIWFSGKRIPNRRYQLAIDNLNQNFKSMNRRELGIRLNNFLFAHGLDVDFLADELGVTARTAQAYLNGERRPRAINRVATLLSTPTPV